MSNSKRRGAPSGTPHVELRLIHRLKPNPHNTRVHPNRQIRQLADSIRAFGCVAPLLVDEDDVLLAGHARKRAAESLGLKFVPVIVLAGLSPAKKRALLLADNRIAENAGWNRQQLAVELPQLQEILAVEGLDIALTGFDPVEIDTLQCDFEDDSCDPADDLKSEWAAVPSVTIRNDLWLLGNSPPRLR